MEWGSKTTLCYAVESARSRIWYADMKVRLEAMVRTNVRIGTVQCNK